VFNFFPEQVRAIIRVEVFKVGVSSTAPPEGTERTPSGQDDASNSFILPHNRSPEDLLLRCAEINLPLSIL
jgi:hypothetical protein